MPRSEMKTELLFLMLPPASGSKVAQHSTWAGPGNQPSSALSTRTQGPQWHPRVLSLALSPVAPKVTTTLHHPAPAQPNARKNTQGQT